MLKLDSVKLASLAPPSITGDEKVKAVFEALDPELRNIYGYSREILIYSRIDELPENIVDLLAWQLHVDFYELAENLETKRELVKNSIEWHRHKGTSYAVVKALEMFGVEARFVPWFEEISSDPADIHDLSEFPPLTGTECLLTETEISRQKPYTFAVDARLSDDFFKRVDLNRPTQTIKKAVNESKAARSFPAKIYVHFEDYVQKELRIAQITPRGIYRRVSLSQPVSRCTTHGIGIKSRNQAALTLKMDISRKDKTEFLTHEIYSGSISSKGIYARTSLEHVEKRRETQTLQALNSAVKGICASMPVKQNEKRQETLELSAFNLLTGGVKLG